LGDRLLTFQAKVNASGPCCFCDNGALFGRRNSSLAEMVELAEPTIRCHHFSNFAQTAELAAFVFLINYLQESRKSGPVAPFGLGCRRSVQNPVQ
jgi:hypothetical protein